MIKKLTNPYAITQIVVHLVSKMVFVSIYSKNNLETDCFKPLKNLIMLTLIIYVVDAILSLFC